MNPILTGLVGFLSGVVVASGIIGRVVYKNVYLPYVQAQQQLNNTNYVALSHLNQYNAGLTETVEQLLMGQPKPSDITEEELSRGYA